MNEWIVTDNDEEFYKRNNVPELIRCKDCKFYHKTEDDQFCGQGSVVAFDEHYCSIAERKEE